jgi:hypothetical protein
LLSNPEALAEHLHHRAQRDRAAMRNPVRLDHGHRFCSAALHELEAKTALAGAGGRNDRHHLSLALLGTRQRRLEKTHLVVTTHEA